MENFNEVLKQYTEEVWKTVEQYLPEEEGHQRTVLEAMNYSMRAGGKRLRPLFLREVYRMFGGQGREEEPFMAAIEMIHTFSLVHDDLPCMDNDRLRRGLPTTWAEYGEDMAVLAGDALYGYAFETASKAFDLTEDAKTVGRCIRLLASKSGIFGMIGGQSADVELTGGSLSADQLEFIYRLKTGALLEAPMMIGALLGGADETQLQTVEHMAACVGKAFQIQDDILDVTSTTEQLGKPVHSDEKNEKTTYVTLKGIEQAHKDVERMTEEAIDELKKFPAGDNFLEQLLKSLVYREK